jgi:hypothetical protein
MNQTFEQYSKQKVEDLINLQNIFPEHFPGDFKHFKEELNIVEHMNDVKNALEIVLKRKMNWRDVDHYSNVITEIVHINLSKSIEKNEITIPKTLEEGWVLVRTKFCEFLGIKMIDEKVYIDLCSANANQNKCDDI